MQELQWMWILYVCFGLFFSFLILLGGIVPLFFDRTAEDWTGNRTERGNDTQQRATEWIEPLAAATRTKPL